MGLIALKTWCLDLLFPALCLGCGGEGRHLCAPCRAGLRSVAPACPVCQKRNFTGILCPACRPAGGLRRFLAPYSYRDPLVRELIHTYKYDGVRELAGLFADEIVAFLARYGIHPRRTSFLIPVPLARSRERERGFNQAGLLAHELGNRLGFPVIPALKRIRATEQQIDMDSYDRRRENVAGAFRVRDAETVRDKFVILVDDVSTSGATLAEAAGVLRAAGARTVWAIAIAKGNRPADSSF